MNNGTPYLMVYEISTEFGNFPTKVLHWKFDGLRIELSGPRPFVHFTLILVLSKQEYQRGPANC